MKNKKKYFQSNNGFTFIELMVVISIVALITLVAIISFTATRQSSRDNQRKSDLKNLAVALETFYSRNVYNRGGEYPPEDYANECDSSVAGQCNTNPTTLVSWAATSDLQELITQKILTRLPIDPINKTVGGINYIYIYEPDQVAEGSPQCTGAVADQTCRYVLQTLLEKDDCIYTLKGGYGNPNSMNLPSDCSGNIVPAGWAGKSCCAQ